MSHIEVITFNQRRRRYTAEQKAQCVALSMQAGSSVSGSCTAIWYCPKFVLAQT
jgi:hypothetical protein